MTWRYHCLLCFSYVIMMNSVSVTSSYWIFITVTTPESWCGILHCFCYTDYCSRAPLQGTILYVIKLCYTDLYEPSMDTIFQFILSGYSVITPWYQRRQDDPPRMIRRLYMMTSSKWIHFPRYWLFVRGINRSAVKSPHKGQWRGKLMISLICSWINGWENNQPQHCCTWTVKTAICQWFPWKFNHQSFFLKARLYISLIYWGLEKNCHRFVDSIFKLLFLKENIPINVMKYERKTIPTTFEKRLGLKQHY